MRNIKTCLHRFNTGLSLTNEEYDSLEEYLDKRMKTQKRVVITVSLLGLLVIIYSVIIGLCE